MRTRKTMALAAATSGLLLLAACGNGNSDGGDAAANGNGDGEQRTVTFDMWAGGESEVEALEAQIAHAEEQLGDVTIELRSAPWNDFFTQLTTRISSGDMACVTGMNGQRLSGYAEAFLPLGEEELATAGIDPAEFTDGSLDIMTHDGVLRGLPYDVSAMMVFYNKDAFAEQGATEPELGWSFEDFETALQDVHTDEMPAFGIGLGEFQWMSLPIARAEQQPVNEAGELDLTNPAFVEAAEWYADLALEGYGEAPPSASETGWGEQQYEAGNVAMAVDGTWNAVSYLDNQGGFEAGMVDLPSGAGGGLSLVLGSGYGVSADCEDPETALRTLGALVGEAAQDEIASSGRSYPARISSQPLFFEALDEDIRDEVEAAFDAAFTNLEGQRSTDNWAQVNEMLQPNLVSVFTGQTSMSEVLENAQQQFGE